MVRGITTLKNWTKAMMTRGRTTGQGEQGLGAQKRNQLWSEENMATTLEDFDSGMSMRNFASAHGIPYSTF
jgi:hypothetical protein